MKGELFMHFTKMHCLCGQKRLCRSHAPVSVVLYGGVLEIAVDGSGTAIMTGRAESIYEGDAEI